MCFLSLFSLRKTTEGFLDICLVVTLKVFPEHFTSEKVIARKRQVLCNLTGISNLIHAS